MRLERTAIDGALVLEVERREDERGFFARTFCRDELAAVGIAFTVVQANVSYNRRRGTLRGMHFQRAPHEEPKIVRCTRGVIWDVAVDLRPGSPTRHQWVGVELDAESRRSLYVAPGLAHGFLTLADDAEVEYLMGAEYVASAASGVRWDDPVLGIRWPFPPVVIAARDAAFPGVEP